MNSKPSLSMVMPEIAPLGIVCGFDTPNAEQIMKEIRP